MSTSLLYHAFGIRGYQYTRTDYQAARRFSPSTKSPRPVAAPPAGLLRSKCAAASSGASNRAHRQTRHVRCLAHPPRQMP